MKRGTIVVVSARRAITAEVGECDAREVEAVDDGLRRWLGLA